MIASALIIQDGNTGASPKTIFVIMIDLFRSTGYAVRIRQPQRREK